MRKSLIKSSQANLVLPADNHVRKGGRQILDVAQLVRRQLLVAELHRPAGIDGERAEQVRFVLMQANERFAGAGEDLPIEPAQVFAAAVLAKVDELACASLLARAVAAGVASLDPVARGEAHAREPRERLQIEKFAARGSRHDGISSSK
jgi:hypothetical protein